MGVCSSRHAMGDGHDDDMDTSKHGEATEVFGAPAPDTPQEAVALESKPAAAVEA